MQPPPAALDRATDSSIVLGGRVVDSSVAPLGEPPSSV